MLHNHSMNLLNDLNKTEVESVQLGKALSLASISLSLWNSKSQDFGSKEKLGLKEMFGPKETLGLKKFWVQINFGSEKI